jgi:hypothetical protein
MASNPMIVHGGALAFEPGYADNAAGALRNLRPATDVVDFELEHHPDPASIAQLGFWIYLMSDCLLFAGLFATYSVLHARTAGGPAPAGLFDLPYVLGETVFLLASSFTCGLATLAAGRRSRGATLGWLAVTFVLGLAFVGMEVHEFAHYDRGQRRAGPQRLSFQLLHARCDARTARHLRPRLDGDHDGAGGEEGLHAVHRIAALLPEPLLALPRHHLGRGVLPGLSLRSVLT